MKFGATYDPSTDKIEGCEPGTFEYWHEERHRWQNKNFPFENLFAQLAMPLIVFGLVFQMWLFIWPVAVYLLGTELDAMVWALRKQWGWVK